MDIITNVIKPPHNHLCTFIFKGPIRRRPVFSKKWHLVKETSTYIRSNMVFVTDGEERTYGLTPGVMIFIPSIMKISRLERIGTGTGMETYSRT
jgi:hypothetical protein